MVRHSKAVDNVTYHRILLWIISACCCRPVAPPATVVVFSDFCEGREKIMYLSLEFGVSASRDSKIKYYPLNLMPVTVKIASVPCFFIC